MCLDCSKTYWVNYLVVVVGVSPQLDRFLFSDTRYSRYRNLYRTSQTDTRGTSRDVSKQTRKTIGMSVRGPFISASCVGERCFVCKEQATHKIEESIFGDEPKWWARHPYTSYLCCKHFQMVLGGCIHQENRKEK